MVGNLVIPIDHDGLVVLGDVHQRGLRSFETVAPEHGELLDLAHGGTGTPEDGPRVIELELDEHDPCAFAPLAQPADDDGRAPRPLLAGLVAMPEVPPAQAPRAPAFPRYLLAPKQSPPRRVTS